jgi:DNA-binding MarR family transcriptional regulator
MPRQLLSEQSLGVDAFVALVRTHATATRALNAQLSADHGLTVSDYEVLLRLSGAPDHRLRRVDLAEQVLLTASGITRLLDGLERQGWVERGACDSDRRVVYAVLTDAGVAKIPQIEAYFGRALAPEEQALLVELLGKLDDGGIEPPCDADV